LLSIVNTIGAVVNLLDVLVETKPTVRMRHMLNRLCGYNKT